MTWLDVALVTITIGTALIIISPLARLMGLYGPTTLVESGFVFGMYGKPTWRFWALFVLFFVVHAASHFEKGSLLVGSAWALMVPVYLIFMFQASRRPREESGQDGEAATE